MDDLLGIPVIESDDLPRGNIRLGDWSTYMRISITGCARCGNDHKDLEFHQLTQPMVDADGTWTHFALCPTNGEPILLKINITSGDSTNDHR